MLKYKDGRVGTNAVIVDSKLDSNSLHPISNQAVCKVMNNSDRMQIQHGSFDVTTVAGATITKEITFNKPFKNKPSIILTAHGTMSPTFNNNIIRAWVHAPSVTNEKALIRVGAYITDLSYSIEWVAIGK